MTRALPFWVKPSGQRPGGDPWNFSVYHPPTPQSRRHNARGRAEIGRPNCGPPAHLATAERGPTLAYGPEKRGQRLILSGQSRAWAIVHSPKQPVLPSLQDPGRSPSNRPHWAVRSPSRPRLTWAIGAAAPPSPAACRDGGGREANGSGKNAWADPAGNIWTNKIFLGDWEWLAPRSNALRKLACQSAELSPNAAGPSPIGDARLG